MQVREDARLRRSRERLTEAVLRLSADRDVGAITVAELAREAGVHRSTVYEHADSPADLLRCVLRGELQETFRRSLQGVPRAELARGIRSATYEVLAHVERREAIYSRALGRADDAALHAMLSGHFRESARRLLDSGAVDTPDPGLDPEFIARVIADGLVGAIDAWLLEPAPRDRDAFVRRYRLMLPDWWPLEATAS